MRKLLVFLGIIITVHCSGIRYEIKYEDTAIDSDRISEIAICDFVNNTDIDLVGLYAADRLQEYIRKNSEFRIVDRKKIKDIFKELNIPISEVNDPKNIKKISEKLPIEAIMTGTVIGIDDPHTQYYYTKNFDTSFKVQIRITDIESGRVLYNNHCQGSEEDMTIRHENPQFIQKRIAHTIIDQCIKSLASEFLPRKIRVPVK